MGALSKKEVAHYVNHRLAVAGSAKEVFPPPTLGALRRLSGGIPRVVNVICDRALLGAYAEGKQWVDRHTLVKAAREVLGALPRGGGGAGTRKLRWALVPAALLLLLVLTWAGYYLVQKPGSFEIPGPRAGGASLPANAQAPEPPLPSREPLILPKGVSAETTKASAYESLFKHWEISYKNGSESPCQQARSQGLQCLLGQGTITTLRGLDRPAVLKLYGENGQEHYVTLLSLDEDQATITMGDATRVTTPEELAKKWLGEYALLWKSPEGYQNPLRPGQRSRFVPWVESSLALLEDAGPSRRRNTLFDEKLARAVKKFQFDQGIQPTGIVGPETVIRILNATGTDDPTLSD
jgi:general secretion pathway protein A